MISLQSKRKNLFQVKREEKLDDTDIRVEMFIKFIKDSKNDCGATGCTNRSEHNKNLTFYRIVYVRRGDEKEWLHNLQRKIIPATVNVCSDHFKTLCYECDMRSELIGRRIDKNFVRGRYLWYSSIGKVHLENESPPLTKTIKKPKKVKAKDGLRKYHLHTSF